MSKDQGSGGNNQARAYYSERLLNSADVMPLKDGFSLRVVPCCKNFSIEETRQALDRLVEANVIQKYQYIDGNDHELIVAQV